jgi:glycosyltransferase involved in cell wall biosynthesis
MEENMDGIRVIRTWIWPSNSRKVIPRLLCYFSWVLSSVFLGIWGLGKQDVVLFESPPLFVVPSGLLIGKVCRGRIVMNVSDIWPDIIVRMGHTTQGAFLRAMEWLEEFGYKHSDVVALTNPGAMDQIKRRFPGVATTVISNGVDTDMFRPELASQGVRQRLGAEIDDFLVIYCGLHGMAQGLEVIVNAAARLVDRSHIKFVMMGDGPTKEMLVGMAAERQLPNLTFLDRRPKKEIPEILASCDVSLVPLMTHLPGTMPSKVYEALSAGTPPIVAKGCEGDPLVEQFNAGRTFEPLNGEDLATAVVELADDPAEYQQVRENAIALSRRFDRDAIAERTEKVLSAIAEGQRLPDVSW